MLEKINSILKSPTTKTLLTAGVDTISTSRSKTLPPVALGGSIVLGILTTLFGAYKIADCVRYQTASGQCDVVIKENLPTIAAGMGTFSAGWGGFNTFNPKLREKPIALPTKELVLEPDNIPEPQSPVTPHPEVIKNLIAEGNSQMKTAKLLGITVYAVRKALKE